MSKLAKYLGLTWATNLLRHHIAITDWYYTAWLTYWMFPVIVVIYYHMLMWWPHYTETSIVTGATMAVALVPLLYASKRRAQNRNKAA